MVAISLALGVVIVNRCKDAVFIVESLSYGEREVKSSRGMLSSVTRINKFETTESIN